MKKMLGNYRKVLKSPNLLDVGDERYGGSTVTEAFKLWLSV